MKNNFVASSTHLHVGFNFGRLCARSNHFNAQAFSHPTLWEGSGQSTRNKSAK